MRQHLITPEQIAADFGVKSIDDRIYELLETADDATKLRVLNLLKSPSQPPTKSAGTDRNQFTLDDYYDPYYGDFDPDMQSYQ